MDTSPSECKMHLQMKSDQHLLEALYVNSIRDNVFICVGRMKMFQEGAYRFE